MTHGAYRTIIHQTYLGRAYISFLPHGDMLGYSTLPIARSSPTCLRSTRHTSGSAVRLQLWVPVFTATMVSTSMVSRHSVVYHSSNHRSMTLTLIMLQMSSCGTSVSGSPMEPTSCLLPRYRT